MLRAYGLGNRIALVLGDVVLEPRLCPLRSTSWRGCFVVLS